MQQKLRLNDYDGGAFERLTLDTLPPLPIDLPTTVDEILSLTVLENAALYYYEHTGRGRRQDDIREPWSGAAPPIGTWVFWPETREFALVWPFNPFDLKIHDATQRHPAYATYCQWRAAGHLPPPVDVVRHTDSRALVCLNNQRVLVARALRLPILALYTESLPTDAYCWQIRVERKEFDERIRSVRRSL